MGIKENRMVAPDIIKIMAAVLVIFTHHKSQRTPRFYVEYSLLFLLFLLIATGICLWISRYGTKKHWNETTLYWAKRAPFLGLAALFLLYKFAVSFFLMMSGFMLTASLEKTTHPVREWYRPGVLLPRILRFYLPFIPILILGLLIQIFLKDMTYEVSGIAKRFFLGGFAPGSYYIVVMVQFLFLFPFLYLIVKRWQGKGIVFLLLITLLWDLFATCWVPISEKSYKFCALRLIPQMSLGIYAKLTEFKNRPIFQWFMFAGGFVCYCLFDFFPWNHSALFYQWKTSCLFVAVFLYPVVIYLLSAFQRVSYPDSPFSRSMITCSNATYHIFLVQMLYYNMIGYAWNKEVNHIFLTMPVNLLVCITGGILYYRCFSPVENRVLKGVKARLKKECK